MPFDNWFNFDFCCFRYDLSSIETLDPEVAKELIRNWQIEKSRPKAMAKELIAQTGEKTDCTKNQVSKKEKKKWKNVALSFLLNLGGGVTAHQIILNSIIMIISGGVTSSSIIKFTHGYPQSWWRCNQS